MIAAFILSEINHLHLDRIRYVIFIGKIYGISIPKMRGEDRKFEVSE